MKAASVALPTLRITATRTLAMITGTASGSSTRNSTAVRDIPMPRPASMSDRSTPWRPTMVLRSTGSADTRMRAITAFWKPMPTVTASRTSTPMDGTACPTLASARNGADSRRSRGRVSSTPSGIAIARTSAVDTATRPTCSPNCRTISFRSMARRSIGSRSSPRT